MPTSEPVPSPDASPEIPRFIPSSNWTYRGFASRYAFLSNFYDLAPACVGLKKGDSGTYTFFTVEAAYQAAKFPVERWDEFCPLDAAAAKRHARRLNRMGIMIPNWHENAPDSASDLPYLKLRVMENLVRQKFLIPDLKQRLLDTGDKDLVELNTWGDSYWGVVRIGNEYQGHNHLGRILMETRQRLRERRE